MRDHATGALRLACKQQGLIKPLFCVLEKELLSASDELLRETGQPHHVVRSHNELNVAKLASCVSMFLWSPM